MADFYQNGVITTLHNLSRRPTEDLEAELAEGDEDDGIVSDEEAAAAAAAAAEAEDGDAKEGDSE